MQLPAQGAAKLHSKAQICLLASPSTHSSTVSWDPTSPVAQNLPTKQSDGVGLQPGGKEGHAATQPGSPCQAGSSTPSPHPWSAKPGNMQNLILFLGSRRL